MVVPFDAVSKRTRRTGARASTRSCPRRSTAKSALFNPSGDALTQISPPSGVHAIPFALA